MQNLVVLVLVVVAAGLGYLIWENGNPIVATPGYTPQPQPKQTQNNQQTAFDCDKYNFNTKVMLSVTNSSSDEEKFCHYQYAISQAKNVTTVDISGCDPDPVVLGTKEAAIFKVVNNDPEKRRIVFDPEHSYQIQAKSSMNIKADFGNGPGLYGYGCDLGKGGATGMIFVAPN